jgi:penicillin-binding protein 2
MTQILALRKADHRRGQQALGKAWSLPDDTYAAALQAPPLAAAGVFHRGRPQCGDHASTWRKKLEPLLGANLVLQGSYMRHYPQERRPATSSATQARRVRCPLGPIVDGDQVFEEMEGREGIETAFDSDLKGQPGIVNVLFSPDGKRSGRGCARVAVPGRNVVLSIDYNFQKYAERRCSKHTTSGAMVIMDVTNGDILAMASNPFLTSMSSSPASGRSAMRPDSKIRSCRSIRVPSAASIRPPRPSRS